MKSMGRLSAYLSLAIFSSCLISIYSCNNPTENTSSKPSSQVDNKTDLSSNSNSTNNSNNVNKTPQKLEDGTLKFTVDNSLFKSSSKDKDLDLDKNVKRLYLEVKGSDLSKPLISTENWQTGKSTSFSISVPEGNNRIVTLSALDSGGRILTTFMGAVNIKSKQDNNIVLNSLNTAVGQTLLNILNNNNSILNNVNLDDLNSYFTKLTGFNLSNNTSKTDPSVINTSMIAQEIIKNNGKVPESTDNLQKTGSLVLNINETGVKVLLSDLNSNVINSTSQNQVTIDKVSLGEWYATFIKDGLMSQSVKVNIKEGNNTLKVDLPKDGKLPIQSTSKPIDVKVLAPIKDNDFGIAINNYAFTDGIALGNSGGVERNSTGSVNLPGFGSHNISIKMDTYPVMSNTNNKLTITDSDFTPPTAAGFALKGTGSGVIVIESDQELQYITISFGNYKMDLEANLDGSWTVTFADQQTIINTEKDVEGFILKNLALSNISVHSLAALYTLIQNRENIPMEIKAKTLSGADVSPIPRTTGGFYDSRQNVLDLINKVLTALNNLKSLLEPKAK